MDGLFAKYDRLREPWRLCTALGCLCVILIVGLLVRAAGYFVSGWLITIVPLAAVARWQYLRH